LPIRNSLDFYAKSRKTSSHMNASGEPITKCPVCRYDLTGLSKNHTCPECGFQYDESMRIWFAKKPGWILVIISFVPVLIMLGMLFWAATKTAVPSQLYVKSIMGGSIIPVLLAVLTLLGRRQRSFVVVSDGGLSIKTGAKKVRFLPWGQLFVPAPENSWWRKPTMLQEETQQLSLIKTCKRLLTRDLGGLNLRSTLFEITAKDGETQSKPLRLLTGSISPKKRRALHRQIYDRWCKANTNSEPGGP